MYYMDIGDNHRYRKEIYVVTHQGLMSEMADGSFNGDAHMTIASFFALIDRILGYRKVFLLPTNNAKSRDNEVFHWAEGYFRSCRAFGIDYSSDFTPDSELTFQESYSLLDSLTAELSRRFQLKFGIDYTAFRNKYFFNQKSIPINCTQVACLIFWYCQNIGDQLLQHDTYTTNNELLIATQPALFFLRFVDIGSSEKLELFWIANLLNQNQCYKSDVYKSLKRILASKNDVLESLKYNNSKLVYHYTSLKTLINLAPNSYGFHLSNAAFLNDPSEGKLLLEEFQKRFSKEFEPNDHSAIPVNCTYLASFNPTDDSLPMWFQYGDKATGCAIGFEPSEFKLPIYHIQYDFQKFQPFFDQVNLELKNDNNRPYISTLLHPCISRYLEFLGYLYKKPYYEHEQELRIIKLCQPKDAIKESFPRNGELLPRTYVDVPYKISSVTFGANVPDPQKLTVGFSSIGLSCRFISSEIPFRN